MAHKISKNQRTGKDEIALALTPAWHGLGTVVDGAMTSEEAIRQAGLDWSVEKWPLVAYGPDDVAVEVPDRYSTVRTDTNTPLGVVGSQFTVFQNRTCFEFMDSLVGEKLAIYDVAGALDYGRKVWMLCKIPTEYRIVKDDVVQPYTLLCNGHDGSLALKVFPTSIRVVCWNTLRCALGAYADGITVHHYAHIERRAQKAKEVLGLSVKEIEGSIEQMRQLAKGKVKQAEIDDYFGRLFPTLVKPAEAAQVKKGIIYADSENIAERNKAIDEAVRRLLQDERQTMKGVEGTYWALYNAVSQWADHERPHGRVAVDTQVAAANKRFNDVFFGEASRLKSRAFELALTLAS
jgi:phage/plasmid-like protein (TIGR03299 family)